MVKSYNQGFLVKYCAKGDVLSFKNSGLCSKENET